MSLTIATWNINSVRLRSGLVQKLLTEERPDILCLQETKCPNDSFPLADFRKLGYQHIAMNGQKGYHGVAILSRLPFTTSQSHDFADKSDCRHISITLGKEARKAAGFTIHNFYVPAGGDIPDPEQNEKFDHKLRYLEDMIRWGSDHQPAAGPAIPGLPGAGRPPAPGGGPPGAWAKICWYLLRCAGVSMALICVRMSALTLSRASAR